MSVASEVHLTLQSMGFVQLLLALAFLTGYAVACSALFEPAGRWRGAACSLVAGVAFVGVTQPWVHGAMLLAAAVGGMGLFSATAWLLGQTLRLPHNDGPLAIEAELQQPPSPHTGTVAPQPLPRDGVHAT
jgi:hypothetical protein